MENVEYQRMYLREDTHWWFQQRLHLVRQLIKIYVPETGRILDAGCGTGLVLSNLQKEYQVTGIDVAPQALDFCRQRGLHALYLGCIGNLSIPERNFDAVLCLDVLEHIDSEAAAIADFDRLLRPGGKLILTVPAHPELWNTHDVQMHHVRRYTREHLQELISDGGWQIDWLSYTNAVALPIAHIRRTWHQEHRTQSSSDVDASGGILASAVMGTSGRLENWWLRSHTLGFGLSLACVASKPR
jgi:SAM-dependent methyltransferase